MVSRHDVQGLVGKKCWYADGVLEIRERSDAEIVDISDEYVVVRHFMGARQEIPLDQIHSIRRKDHSPDETSRQGVKAEGGCLKGCLIIFALGVALLLALKLGDYAITNMGPKTSPISGIVLNVEPGRSVTMAELKTVDGKKHKVYFVGRFNNVKNGRSVPAFEVGDHITVWWTEKKRGRVAADRFEVGRSSTNPN